MQGGEERAGRAVTEDDRLGGTGKTWLESAAGSGGGAGGATAAAVTCALSQSYANVVVLVHCAAARHIRRACEGSSMTFQTARLKRIGTTMKRFTSVLEPVLVEIHSGSQSQKY